MFERCASEVLNLQRNELTDFAIWLLGKFSKTSRRESATVGGCPPGVLANFDDFSSRVRLADGCALRLALRLGAASRRELRGHAHEENGYKGTQCGEI